jgi:hypothetical protein
VRQLLYVGGSIPLLLAVLAWALPMIEAAEALVGRLRKAGEAGFDIAHEMHATAIDALGRPIMPGLIDDPPSVVAMNVRRFAGVIRLGDLLRFPGGCWYQKLHRTPGDYVGCGPDEAHYRQGPPSP